MTFIMEDHGILENSRVWFQSSDVLLLLIYKENLNEDLLNFKANKNVFLNQKIIRELQM